MGTSVARSHVLVLDDTPALLDQLRDLLEAAGYCVSVASEPLDLLAIVALEPDVIVLDLLVAGSPDTDWQFLTMIQLDPVLSRLPLILCTAAAERVQEPTMAEHLDRQGVRVLLKPFDLVQLVTTVGEELAAQNLINQALAPA
jgi:CheY-like chemotaxis protein